MEFVKVPLKTIVLSFVLLLVCLVESKSLLEVVVCDVLCKFIRVLNHILEKDLDRFNKWPSVNLLSSLLELAILAKSSHRPKRAEETPETVELLDFGGCGAIGTILSLNAEIELCESSDVVVTIVASLHFLVQHDCVGGSFLAVVAFDARLRVPHACLACLSANIPLFAQETVVLTDDSKLVRESSSWAFGALSRSFKG